MRLLTRLEKRHLKYLGNLLSHGRLRLETLNSVKYQLTHLQNFLLFNHIAIHNYSEAIHLLCKDARPDAACVLLRSIFEADTNAEYIKFGDPDKKLAQFAKEGFIERRKVANGFDQFVKKYPNRKDLISVLKEDEIEKLKNFTKNFIDRIDSVNKLYQEKSYPDIFARSLEIDENSSNSKKNGDVELYYHLVYRYLSPRAHLNAYGLEMFVKGGVDKRNIFVLGRTKDVHFIIIQTYLYYFTSFFNLYDKKVLNGEMPEKYKRYCEELKNTKIN